MTEIKKTTKETKIEKFTKEVRSAVLNIVRDIAGDGVSIGSTKALNSYIDEKTARIVKEYNK